MILHLTAGDLAVLLVPTTSLLGLWLRLSWRTRQEHARHGTLVDLAQTLPPDSELEETAADGTRLRIARASSEGWSPDGRSQGAGSTATVGEGVRR